jgi:hypothetical protein
MPNRDGVSRTSMVLARRSPLPAPRSPGRPPARTPGMDDFSSIMPEENSSHLSMTPQNMLVPKGPPLSESAVLGLRAAVHSTHGPVDDTNRQKTYIVATYTAELDESDEHERWYVPDPAGRPDVQLNADELEVHRELGLYTSTKAGTDASVYVELIGTNGSSCGPQQLSHGKTMKHQIQEELDSLLDQVGFLEEDGEEEPAYGLRFKGNSATLTKEHKERLDLVALLLTKDYGKEVKKVVVEGLLGPEKEDSDDPIHDRHPMYNKEISAMKEIAYQRMKAVRDYLRVKKVDPTLLGESFTDNQDMEQFAGRTFSSRLPMRLNKSWSKGMTYKNFKALPDERRPPELRLIVEEIHEEHNEHATFQAGHVDEFAITANDLGDLCECRIWHLNDGVDMQSSRWKLDKVVVTCIQSHNTSGASGYTSLHPHGKGDNAIRSVKTSDSDQWHFLAHGHWLSVDKGSDLLMVNDEIRRVNRRIQMVREETAARIQELENEKKKLQKKKDKMNPSDEPEAEIDDGAMMVIPLEDNRPLPFAVKKAWFEEEVYIDYRDPEEYFSHLLTKTKDRMKPMQLILNGALDEEGSPDWYGGYIKPGCWGVEPGTERAVHFHRTGDDGDDYHPGDPMEGSLWNPWKYVQMYLAGEYYSIWDKARGYKPRDLDNGEKGEEPEQGPRIEQAIWSLKRVGTNPRAREWGLFYIVKKDKQGTWGLSIENEDTSRRDEIPAEGRVLGLDSSDKEWLMWAPQMVTHRGDEFIFEVRGKCRLNEDSSPPDWLETYGGRTLTFGKGAIEPSCCGWILDKLYRITPCRLGTPIDEGDVKEWEEGKLGERGEEGDLLLTNERWRDGKAEETDEEVVVNHISPNLRGHQVWRLSIPADKETEPEEPYEPPEYKVYNFFMDWTNRAFLQVCLIIGAVFGSAIWAGFAGGWVAFWASLGGTFLGTAIVLVASILFVTVYVNISCAGRPLDDEDERRP